jgi:glucose-6-phosphate dehydrogenase assembly protein OpcA
MAIQPGAGGAGGGGAGGGGAGGGLLVREAGEPGRPMLRWSSRASSIDGIQDELARIWSSISLAVPGEEGEERRVAARSSVMNLVVVAGRSELGERAAAIITGLTGRHPSRTIVVTPADPDGPSWIDAQVQAHCVLPSADSPETCAELVYLTAGGEAGQHVAGLVAPLIIHDLPVMVWWPGEARLESPATRDLLKMADRLLVDGSAWSGDGLDRLVTIARLPARFGLEVIDFALVRQARWREAIASSFDLPRLRPFLGGIRAISVTYAAHDGTPRSTNVVRPVYHLAWLGSRLGMAVVQPLLAAAEPWAGYAAELRAGRRRVAVSLRPAESPAPGGTTLDVRLEARRRRETLDVRVTAQAEGVTVETVVDGARLPDRRYLAPRRREGDLLAETIEESSASPLAAEILAMAASLAGAGQHGSRHDGAGVQGPATQR